MKSNSTLINIKVKAQSDADHVSTEEPESQDTETNIINEESDITVPNTGYFTSNQIDTTGLVVFLSVFISFVIILIALAKVIKNNKYTKSSFKIGIKWKTVTSFIMLFITIITANLLFIPKLLDQNNVKADTADIVFTSTEKLNLELTAGESGYVCGELKIISPTNNGFKIQSIINDTLTARDLDNIIVDEIPSITNDGELLDNTWGFSLVSSLENIPEDTWHPIPFMKEIVSINEQTPANYTINACYGVKTSINLTPGDYITNVVYQVTVNTTVEPEPEPEPSPEEFYSEMDQFMIDKGYNEYAITVVDTLIPDYQKLFTNDEIRALFNKVISVTLNPYDPENPDLSYTDRAYNSGGKIVVNCFEGELDNNSNFSGLRWLLTHEIMHSLGDFPNEYTDGSYGVVLSYNPRNRLLEEALADSIANHVNNIEHITGYNADNPHTYVISGDFIKLFDKVGCYNEIIHANMDNTFENLRVCMVNKVNNGGQYFDSLFHLINGLYLFMDYPNSFPSKEALLNKYTYFMTPELSAFIQNNSISDLWPQYEELRDEIISNKLDD